jgi:hypothetical protein
MPWKRKVHSSMTITAAASGACSERRRAVRVNQDVRDDGSSAHPSCTDMSPTCRPQRARSGVRGRCAERRRRRARVFAPQTQTPLVKRYRWNHSKLRSRARRNPDQRLRKTESGVRFRCAVRRETVSASGLCETRRRDAHTRVDTTACTSTHYCWYKTHNMLSPRP